MSGHSTSEAWGSAPCLHKNMVWIHTFSQGRICDTWYMKYSVYFCVTSLFSWLSLRDSAWKSKRLCSSYPVSIWIQNFQDSKQLDSRRQTAHSPVISIPAVQILCHKHTWRYRKTMPKMLFFMNYFNEPNTKWQTQSRKITQNQPHQLLTEGKDENSWGQFEGKQESIVRNNHSCQEYQPNNQIT